MTTTLKGRGTRSIRVNGSHMALRLRFETLLRKHNTVLDALTNEKLSKLDDQTLAERHVNLLESVIPEEFYPEEPFIGRLILLLREREQSRATNEQLQAEIERLKRSERVFKIACLAGEADLRGSPGCMG